jgi:ligand-binding sensor domain-containing protein/signal transduction histidine kinase
LQTDPLISKYLAFYQIRVIPKLSFNTTGILVKFTVDRKSDLMAVETYQTMLFPRLCKFSYFAFTAIITVLIHATGVLAERLPVTTYTVADGLLRDYVHKIKQDSRGFLWFCTPGGLSRFDGYAFTNFTVDDGLPDRHVNDLLETQSGAIWIATDAGLARLNPKGLRNSPENPLFSVYLPEDPKAKNILNLLEDARGQIFAGTSDGLYRLVETDGRFELEAVDLGKSLTGVQEITSIIKDRRGGLWIGTYLDGLYRLLPDGQPEQFTMTNGLPSNRIESLLEDKNGRIWVGMRAGMDAGLCLLAAEPKKDQKIVERVFSTKDGLPNDWILALIQTSDEQLWVGTIRGLCKWQGEYGNSGEKSVCKTYTANNDLCDTDVWSLTEDKDGNLWTGTRCGAKKLARYGFTTYTERDGIDVEFINSIFENAAGEIFASFDQGDNRTVSRFNGEKFDLVKPNFPSEIGYFGWGTKQTVWQDRAGDWWFPTSNGLYRFQHAVRFADLAKITPQRIAPVAGRIEIFRLFEDSRGDFWIATGSTAGNGLWRWERSNDAWHDYTKELGFSGSDRLGWAFVEDKAGNLWISTSGNESETSLIRYRDGQLKIFTQAEGIPAGVLPDLFVDGKGRLWLASSSTGLLRLDDVHAEQLNFTRYTSSEGLSTQGAACITEDEFGRIYICTARGLDRLNTETGQIENFTTADGLPNSFPQMAFRDRNNRLWFGTTDGLARFTPEPERRRKPPNALIMGLRVDGVPRGVSVLGETVIPALELGSDQRQVTVDFVGLGSSLGEKLKYEYRFGESDWTPTTERTVNFANLASGNYQFEVRTITADRNYSQPATVAFRIATPLWQRWWFIAGLLALTAFLIYGFYRFRLTRLLELERMRTRIATDLHDDIGANLTRIALLSEVANQETRGRGGNGKRNLLPSIADIARESVASMNDIVWAISPDHDSLLDLTRRMRGHAEEVFTFRDIDLEFHAPTADTDLKLSVGVRRDLLLIFKETVNNAARHSACTKVWIDFRSENSILSLRIKDNGKGFETDSENDGQGLRSMTRRAAAHGGKLKIDSSKDQGTTVEFELPLQKQSQL